MRFSQLFSPTLKEAPKDATIASHQLMIRAGMIRQVAAGIYALLPLGLRVVRKFESIVRDCLSEVGAQEILMPAVIPAELWQQSGRWEKYGDELLRLKDRHDNWFCFGPTHEEVVSAIADFGVRSYKQLPMCLYQIQTKFRDEVRPRFGLMRGREFGMKDAYSFHTSTDCLDAYYDKMSAAYEQIFKRAGLASVKIQADSGSIGGNQSAEFMVLANTGEDEVLVCDSCGAGANTEVLADASAACLSCGKHALTSRRGIEVGHIFKLGSLYSTAMNATFQSESGQSQPFEMGCYGIGTGRSVAAAIEQNHDDDGIIWPTALAPYHIDVIVASMKDDALVSEGQRLYDQLSVDYDAVLDDRAVSIGVKFKDAQLIGFPIQIVLGKAYLAEGQFEVVQRATGDKQLMSADQLLVFLQEIF